MLSVVLLLLSLVLAVHGEGKAWTVEARAGAAWQPLGVVRAADGKAVLEDVAAVADARQLRVGRAVTTVDSKAQGEPVLLLHVDRLGDVVALQVRGDAARLADASVVVRVPSDGARVHMDLLQEDVKAPSKPEKGEKGKEEEPGFLRKYWIYIVPALLMLSLSNAAGLEEEKKKK